MTDHVAQHATAGAGGHEGLAAQQLLDALRQLRGALAGAACLLGERVEAGLVVVLLVRERRAAPCAELRLWRSTGHVDHVTHARRSGGRDISAFARGSPASDPPSKARLRGAATGHPAAVSKPRSQHYFRRFPASEDPAQLLRPENQCSTPWGEPEHGPCDKCRGAGTVQYRCRSCLETGASPECPSCGGRARFTDVCPSCEGDGTIDRDWRDGVSVFPNLAGLYRYLAERDAGGDGDCVMLELEGELTGDRDLDADAGALLIRPTRIVARHPFDHERFEARRAEHSRA